MIAVALLIFGIFTFISFLAAFADDDRVRRPALRRLQWPALRTLRTDRTGWPRRSGRAASYW